MCNHYNDLLLDLYEKLGDSHIAYCYSSYQYSQSQPFSTSSDCPPSRVISHAYSGLDCYYTVMFIESILEYRQVSLSQRKLTFYPKRWRINVPSSLEFNAITTRWFLWLAKFIISFIIFFSIVYFFFSFFSLWMSRFNNKSWPTSYAIVIPISVVINTSLTLFKMIAKVISFSAIQFYPIIPMLLRIWTAVPYRKSQRNGMTSISNSKISYEYFLMIE